MYFQSNCVPDAVVDVERAGGAARLVEGDDERVGVVPHEGARAPHALLLRDDGPASLVHCRDKQGGKLGSVFRQLHTEIV